ncbi:hypothetical protein Are01nite_37690 [Actinoplanes regularis]|nr:hypothetical protein Are01nite_37690 [Actinoplanes regularis]
MTVLLIRAPAAIPRSSTGASAAWAGEVSATPVASVATTVAAVSDASRGTRTRREVCGTRFLRRSIRRAAYLGRYRLCDLNGPLLRAVFAEIAQTANSKGQPQSALNHLRTTLRAALNLAAREELIDSTPARHSCGTHMTPIVHTGRTTRRA